MILFGACSVDATGGPLAEELAQLKSKAEAQCKGGPRVAQCEQLFDREQQAKEYAARIAKQTHRDQAILRIRVPDTEVDHLSTLRCEVRLVEVPWGGAPKT